MIDFPKEGVVLIDKPQSWTSHDVVAKVRRLMGVKRVGHAGTLDPLATGLLIVLIGREFTKRQAEFMKQEKEYLVTGQLGLTTDSYDSDGQVVESRQWVEVSKVSRQKVEEMLEQFQGEIDQRVPAFSAVKRGGKKLYDIARAARRSPLAEPNMTSVNGLRSTAIDLPSRRVTIKELELVDFTVNEEQQKATFTLRVVCSSGTYIRSLVHDLGQVLGVGATVTQLRRTRIGEFKVEEAVTLGVH